MAFREVLWSEFQRRQARNRRYSLRAFARALALDHASLSQMMRGRRRLTPRVIRRLGAHLALPLADIDLHCADENDRALLGLLVHTKDSFRADSRWIAARLGIPIDDINVALQRLLRKRALVMSSQRMWTVIKETIDG